MSFPSMRIFPEEHSKIRSKQLIIVDLPAPVRPTIPIFSPLLIFKFKPLRTKGNSGLYLTFVSTNYISPLVITSLLYPSYFVLQF